MAAYLTAGLRLTNLAVKPVGLAYGITELTLRLYKQQDRRSAGPYVDDIADTSVKIEIAGAVVGPNKAVGTNWGTSLGWTDYTWTEAQLLAAGVPLSALMSEQFGFLVSATKSGATDTIDAVIDDHEVVITYAGLRKPRQESMDHVNLKNQGGMKVLLQEALPTVSSSATIFANAPAGTRFVLMSVDTQDVYLSFSGTATSTNGIKIPAGSGPHWFALSQAAALACRAIQAGATATGTIVYLG